MKRIWIWMLCVVLAFSLTACNGCNETNEPATDPDTSTTDGSDPTDSNAPTDSGEATGDSTTSGTGADTPATQDSGSAGKTEGTSADKTGSTDTTGSASGSTTTTTTTTKKSSTASGQTAVTDNFVDWEQAFGTDPTTTTTTKKGDTTATTKPTSTTTTTTTQPTTTTTVVPTVVNDVKLPAVGTDVDVVKQKGRFRVSDIELKDGKVTITIKNENKSWINQETDWVKYACYDKNGNELKGEGEDFGYIYLGCLEEGKTITNTFTLPAGTVEVKLVDSQIVYWTPWQ